MTRINRVLDVAHDITTNSLHLNTTLNPEILESPLWESRRHHQLGQMVGLEVELHREPLSVLGGSPCERTGAEDQM